MRLAGHAHPPKNHQVIWYTTTYETAVRAGNRTSLPGII